MSELHFILDFEAFGQDPITCPIINCSMYMFDWSRFTSPKPYTFEELVDDVFQVKVSVADQIKNYGYKINKKDIDWWDEQGPAAKREIAPSKDDVTLEQFLEVIMDYVSTQRDGRKLQRWWSRSNCYDPVILQRTVNHFNKRDEMEKLLPFWLLRDTRTYIDTRFDFKNKKNGFCPYDDEAEWNRVFVKHNSKHDVAADILRIQKIERTIHL